jgi:hypothetical protein
MLEQTEQCVSSDRVNNSPWYSAEPSTSTTASDLHILCQDASPHVAEAQGLVPVSLRQLREMEKKLVSLELCVVHYRTKVLRKIQQIESGYVRTAPSAEPIRAIQSSAGRVSAAATGKRRGEESVPPGTVGDGQRVLPPADAGAAKRKLDDSWSDASVSMDESIPPSKRTASY